MSRIVVYECPCQVIEKQDHHPDYSSSDLVARLCSQCHRDEHRRLRRNSIKLTPVKKNGFGINLEIVKNRMNELGLSASELARRMGCSRQNVYQLFTGKIGKGMKTAGKLGVALQMDGKDLLTFH